MILVLHFSELSSPVPVVLHPIVAAGYRIGLQGEEVILIGHLPILLRRLAVVPSSVPWSEGQARAGVLTMIQRAENKKKNACLLGHDSHNAQDVG